MSKVKTCKHPKKFRKAINAGWNNVDIEGVGVHRGLVAWCSNCGSIEVWKDMESTYWLKPKLVEDRSSKTLKLYRGKEDFEDIVEYEYNSQNKPRIFITIYPSKEEYESLKGKNLEVTLLKTVEERLREVRVSAVKNKFSSIPVEEIRSLDLVIAIEEADTEFFKKENNE